MSHRVRRPWIAVVPAVSLMALAGAAAAAPSQGETLFNQRCGTCHAIAPGGAAKMGPPLAGMIGRKAGTVPGFSYSAAMKKSGIVWDAARLDAYIAKPAAVVPGTTMMVGMPGDPAQRAAVVAFLAAQK
ncbi:MULTISPECIES: c-type cytochrome [Phenylobacterium]|uniref:Cytochrome c n=1 Tax=Phenylobacterium koreense TaxID=266125 RepID=A0ABV2EI36_9CAUL